MALVLVAAGILSLVAATAGAAPLLPKAAEGAFFWVAMLGLGLGSVWYAVAQYRHQPLGIKNNHNFSGGITHRGALAWLLALVLTGFYTLLYWYPELLGLGQNGGANTGLVHAFDPLSKLLKNQPASQWFVYGTLYTLLIAVLGFKFILKYRHNKYQVWRTVSVIFFQTIFAFLLPEFLLKLNLPYNDFKNAFPLNYYFFFDWHLNELLKSGNIGIFMLVWGVALTLIVTPVLTYFYGKRWYCSWVCGCGGLAETAGDSFRHLSDKSVSSWKLERWLVHTILGLVLLTTAAVLYTYFTGNSQLLGFIDSYVLREWYGFGVGAAFSGVVGVGFYPILGSRVWCRFGCPMAAYLGVLQKYFSRFRITTNGAQCISCGNCSTYCEMGIDVKSYAQKGQNIVRASCVGCGICSAVCPRGVLKLENGKNTDYQSRTEYSPISLGNDGITVKNIG